MNFVPRPNAAIFFIILSLFHFEGATKVLGLTIFQKLKDDKYDFSIIDRATGLLLELKKNTARPSHCPLNQTNNQDFLDKLMHLETALKTSACQEYKDNFLSSFSNAVSKLSRSNLTSPIEQEHTLTPYEQKKSHYRNVSHMVDSLSRLVSDSRCAFDIKERGLIPVVSDILGSASVAALYVPNQFAYLGGLGGLAVTGSLKIISSLLEPDYDMKKPKDRDNFIKLACSFFDVRSELEGRNFLRIPSDGDVIHHVMVQSYLEALNGMIAWLTRAKNESLEIVANYQDAYIIEQLGIIKFTFYRDLPRYKSRISQNEGINQNLSRSLQYRLGLLQTLEEISLQLPYMYFDEESYRLFSDLKSDLATLVNFRKTLFAENAHHITDQNLRAIFSDALDNIEAILAQEIGEAEKKFDSEKTEDNNTYKDLRDEIVSLFDLHIKKLGTVVEALTEKETELKKIIARKNFTDDDDGTHMDHTIVQEIKTIQKAIYGQYGWRFFEYVRDQAEKELNSFYDNYHEFRLKYSPKTKANILKIEKEHPRRVACATVADILLSINNSRSLVNMATDFIFTNRDFFHENISEKDFYFKIFPKGQSIERQLLTEASTLIRAKKRLDNNHKSLNFPSRVENASYFNRPSVGDLMMAQTYADQRVVWLYKFQTVNMCKQ